jgi:hypothetical protein
MKMKIICATPSAQENAAIDSFVSKFESIKIPKHDMWKQPPKAVIQALLRQIITHNMKLNYPDTDLTTTLYKLAPRLHSTLSDSLIGKDMNSSSFIMIASFVHSNGMEKVLLALQSMYAQHKIDYAVMFVCGKELKRITDGIISSNGICETIDSFRGIFTLPLYLIEIQPADFFDIRNYRHDKKFWKPFLTNQQTFNQLLSNHPGLVRSFGLI